MTQMKQVAERILGMQGQMQAQAIAKMRDAGMGPWDFPVLAASQGVRAAPLTPAQQEMYATQSAAPKDARFHLYSTYVLTQGFEMQELRKAMALLVERHGALRTRFVHHSGSLVQEMVETVDLDRKVGWNTQDISREVWIQGCIQAPLNLEDAGLWRIECKREDQAVLVTVVFHHLIMDAWSMGQLASELAALMESPKNRPLASTQPPHFVDYAAWAALWKQPGREAKQERFWRSYLEGAHLGWKREGRDASRLWGQGKKFTAHWPQELSEALHQRAKELGCTAFLLLLNGFYALLDRIDASGAWAVASTRAHRPAACLESSVGYFVKTALTRTPQGTSLDQRLQNLGLDWQQLTEHEDLSFGRMLKLRSEAGKLPSILFVQHNTPAPRDGQAKVQAISTGRSFARFAWSLRLDAKPGAPVQIRCEYDSLSLSEPLLREAMQAYEQQMRAWLVDGCGELSSADQTHQLLADELRALDQDLPVSESKAEDEHRPVSSHHGEIEARLCEIWAGVLGKDRVLPSDNFFALGGDSISSLQVVSRALRQGWEIKAQDLVNTSTLAQLATRVRAAASQRVGTRALQWTKNPALSPAQRWFFELGLANPGYFNQSQFLVTRAGLDMKTIVSSLSQLLVAHEALRVGFVQQDGQWVPRPSEVSAQSLIDFLTPRVHYVPQAKLSAQAANEEVLARSHAAMRAHDLASGGLFQVIFFDRGFGQEGRLLVVLHHLITDGVSWRLLLSQWEELASGQAALPLQPSPFAVPTRSTPNGSMRAPDLRVDSGLAQSSGDLVAQRVLQLDAGYLPGQAVKSRSKSLLCAWVQAVAEQQAVDRVVVDIESHGREEEAAALCVGWMTERQSFVFNDARQAGAGGGAVDLDAMGEPCWSNVSLCFNDHGQVRVDLSGQEDAPGQGLWARPLRAGTEAIAPSRDPQDRRPYRWTLNCYHRNEQVHLHWIFAPRQHRACTIDGIFARMKALLIQDREPVQAPEAPLSDSEQELGQDMASILEALNQ